MIRNSDGTPYTLDDCFRFYNDKDKAQELFDSWDSELIKIGGSPILYYEILIPPSTIDMIYWESRGKMWGPPVQLFTTYEPIRSQNYQDMFGIDSPDQSISFELNNTETLNILGHHPKIGSRLYTPHKGEHWEIIQRNLDQFQNWGEVRLILICDRFQESLTTNDGKATQKI